MRAAVLIAALLLPLVAAAQPHLAPAGEIVLERQGRLSSWTLCGGLVAAHFDGDRAAIYRLDLKTRTAARVATLPSSNVSAFSRDCTHLALGRQVAAKSHEVRVVRLAGGAVAGTSSLGVYAFPIAALAFNDDASLLAVSTNGGELDLWTLARPAGMGAQAAIAHDGRDSFLRLAVAGHWLVAGAFRGSLRLHTLVGEKLGPPRELLPSYGAHREGGSFDLVSSEIVAPGGGRIFGVALAPHRIVSLRENGDVEVFPLDDAGPRTRIPTGLADAGALALAPGGEIFAVVGGAAAVWRIQPPAAIATLDGLDRVESLFAATGAAFAGPRSLLVGAYHSARLRLYVLTAP